MDDRKKQIKEAHYKWAKEMAKLKSGPEPTETELRSLGRVPFFYAANWADENPRFDVRAYKPGDFIIFRMEYPDFIKIPGFKEAGLKGGVILKSDIGIQKLTDEQLEKIGLKRI